MSTFKIEDLKKQLSADGSQLVNLLSQRSNALISPCESH